MSHVHNTTRFEKMGNQNDNQLLFSPFLPGCFFVYSALGSVWCDMFKKPPNRSKKNSIIAVTYFFLMVRWLGGDWYIYLVKKKKNNHSLIRKYTGLLSLVTRHGVTPQPKICKDAMCLTPEGFECAMRFGRGCYPVFGELTRVLT